MVLKTLFALGTLVMASFVHSGGYGSSQQIEIQPFIQGVMVQAQVSVSVIRHSILGLMVQAQVSELEAQPSIQVTMALARVSA